MRKRTINIGLGIINKAFKSLDDLKALTLAIVLKAMFKSSVVTNFSIRKIIRITGFDFKSTKKAISDGLRLGFFVVNERPDGSYELVVQKLWHEYNSDAIRFEVVKFDDGHINLYFKDGEGNNVNVFANEINPKRQTASDYIDKVMQAAIWKVLWRRGNVFETSLCEYYKRGHRMKNLKIDHNSLDVLRRLHLERNKELRVESFNGRPDIGLSYDSILKIFLTPHNGLTRYKIQKLVKMCEEEGLLKIVHNHIIVSDEMDWADMSGPAAQKCIANINRPNYKQCGVKGIFQHEQQCVAANTKRIESLYYVMDEDGKVIRDLHKTGFMGKGKYAGKLFMQFANDFLITCDLLIKKRRSIRMRIRSAVSKAKREAENG